MGLEMVWNTLWVTLIGSIILIVRKIYGNKIHPQILTMYWGVFLVVSLVPFDIIGQLGASVGDIGLVPEIKYVTLNRQEDFYGMLSILQNEEYGASILTKNVLMVKLAEICGSVWLAGVGLKAAVVALGEIRLRRRVKEECISFHSCVRIKGKKDINVFITEEIGPMVYGVKPSIYVPKKCNGTDAMESILLHEKIHIIRKHHLLLLLFRITGCIYWFLPYYEKCFLRCLREDMEYRCDYEIVQNGYVNPKEYALHLTSVQGCQSGLKVELGFGENQFLRRIHRILDFQISRKKTVCNAAFMGVTGILCLMWITLAYLWQDANGLTKWEVKQAKQSVINLLSATNEGDEQTARDYIYESGPVSNVTDITDSQWELYHMEYQAAGTSYREKIYRTQHEIQTEGFIYLEGILKMEGGNRIWGFSLVFDETDDIWKVYDWGI